MKIKIYIVIAEKEIKKVTNEIQIANVTYDYWYAKDRNTSIIEKIVKVLI